MIKFHDGWSPTKRIKLKSCFNKKFWYADKIGQEFLVRDFPYLSTDGGTLNYCYCLDCTLARAGKQLYEMYEVVGGEKNGSIINIKDCELI